MSSRFEHSTRRVRRLHGIGHLREVDRAKWLRDHPERVLRGEGVSSAKLTEDDVREIRALSKLGWSSVEISQRFKGLVKPPTVRSITNRHTWKHVD